MSNDTKGYNGWTNYETWCVHLWLTNEEPSYRYWREEAARHRKEARTCSNVREGIWTIELAEGAGLASQLKSEIGDASPIEEASLFSVLLGAALSEVDWHEIADAFLEELEPDPKEEDHDQADDEEETEAYAKAEFAHIKKERMEFQKDPLFELGRTVITPEALSTLSPCDIQDALSKHHRGFWGDVSPDDWYANETSLKEGSRLFSVYHTEGGIKFWIITEADRSSTCVLLPGDY
jgi:hypothetical protein